MTHQAKGDQMTSLSGQADLDTIRSAIHQAREVARQIGDLQAANARTIRTLEGALNQALKGALSAPESALEAPSHGILLPEPTAPVSAHRREHRPGNAPKIDGDPELQAFVAARIDRFTFQQIAEEVAAVFPPERRVQKSAIHAWWKRSRKALPRMTAHRPG